jgi:hypothetical protein
MAEPELIGEKHRSTKRRKIYTPLRLNGPCRVGNQVKNLQPPAVPERILHREIVMLLTGKQ